MEKYILPHAGPEQIQLALNEFDYPHPASVHDQLQNLPIDNLLSRYPSLVDDGPLKMKLAEFLLIHPNQLLLVPGADAGIDLIAQTFITPSTTVRIHVPTYSAYQRACLARGCTPILQKEDQDDKEEEKGTDIDVEFLCNPNNPTGSWRSPPLEIRSKLLVVDEVYADFLKLIGHDSSAYSMIHPDMSDNIIVVRSFSKAFGLAGVRLGYLVSSPHTIERLNKYLNPKSVTTHAKRAATAVLLAVDYYQTCAQEMYANKIRIVEFLKREQIVYKGDGVYNFIMIQTMHVETTLNLAADRFQLIFRNLDDRLPGENWIRMTIGNLLHTQLSLEFLTAANHQHLLKKSIDATLDR